MPISRLRHDSRYGGTYRVVRRRFQRGMQLGEVFPCWRCGLPVDPRRWHLGHADDGETIMGPEHPRCNLRAAGRKGAAVTNGARSARRVSLAL